MSGEDHAIEERGFRVGLADGRTATVEECEIPREAFADSIIDYDDSGLIVSCACCDGTGNHGAGYASSPHGGEYKCVPCRGFGTAHVVLPDGERV
jgi:hypothetical protein